MIAILLRAIRMVGRIWTVFVPILILTRIAGILYALFFVRKTTGLSDVFISIPKTMLFISLSGGIAWTGLILATNRLGFGRSGRKETQAQPISTLFVLKMALVVVSYYLLILLGWMMCVVPGVLIFARLAYWLPEIVDRRCSAGEAFHTSLRRTRGNGLKILWLAVVIYGGSTILDLLCLHVLSRCSIPLNAVATGVGSIGFWATTATSIVSQSIRYLLPISLYCLYRANYGGGSALCEGACLKAGN